jgi:hypothetical protein
MCMSCYSPSLAGGVGIKPCLCGAPETQAAMRRLEADLNRRQMLGGMAAVVGMFAGFGLQVKEARAQTPGRPVLLTNLRYFDGTTLAMQTGRDILVQDGRIAGLPMAGQGPEDAERIDCGGRLSLA